MLIDGSARLVVIGNSGSGKSTLAAAIGAATSVPVHDLDLTHWLDDGRKRDEASSRSLVDELAAPDAWIIEGVYGWLAEVALPRATALIWTDVPWSECLDGLVRRGPRRGMTDDDGRALLAWAQAYWTRTTPSSFSGHERIFDGFAGEKLRLTTRRAVSDLMERAHESGTFRAE